MDDSWWSLPGPRRFVDRVVADLRQGKNVVLDLPENTPEGLSRTIREPLADSGWPWETIDIGDDDCLSPVSRLMQQFGLVPPRGTVRTVQYLVEEESFCGHLIWLEMRSTTRWSAWCEFLTEYGHTTRTRVDNNYSRICAVLPGRLMLSAPDEDVRLAYHPWSGQVDELDVQVYAAILLRDRVLPPLQRRIFTAIIAQLAVWDPEVCQRFASKELDMVLEPVSTLLELASDRGWSGAVPTSDESAWRHGFIGDARLGSPLHSAILAMRGDSMELRSRIWAGQVAVLLPLIERQRQKIIAQLSSSLKVPFATPFGVINDLYELEIGHIRHQVRTLTIPSSLRSRIDLVYRIRNYLAHGDIIYDMVATLQDLDEDRC